MHVSGYYDLDKTRNMVEDGAHREAVGGLWEEIGELTFDYLVSEGLSPRHTVLDVGCGCLRVGVHLVKYLEPGRYFGIDISEDLLDVGYRRELGALGLDAKLPRENLVCDGDFDFDRLPGGPRFDVVLAQSVFTHLPLNHIRLCLARLAPVMATGGRFFATVFGSGPDSQWSQPLTHPRGGITTYPARDPYHYRSEDIECAASGLPWTVAEPIDWDHPRDQLMAVFTRV